MKYGTVFVKFVLLIETVSGLDNRFGVLTAPSDLLNQSRSDDTPSSAAPNKNNQYYLLRPMMKPTKYEIKIQHSDIPSTIPSDTPSTIPSDYPSRIPSDTPSTTPSDNPSTMPSDTPSTILSDTPSTFPSDTPSTFPSDTPSTFPSDTPSSMPLDSSSSLPYHVPSMKEHTLTTSIPIVEFSSSPTFIEPNEEWSEGRIECINSNTSIINISSICYVYDLRLFIDVSKHSDGTEKNRLTRFVDTFSYYKALSAYNDDYDCTLRWLNLYIEVVVKRTAVDLKSIPISFVPSNSYNDPDTRSTCDSIEVNGKPCLSCEYCGNATYSADCTNIPFGRKFKCESIRGHPNDNTSFFLFPLTTDAIEVRMSSYNQSDLVHPQWLIPSQGAPCR